MSPRCARCRIIVPSLTARVKTTFIPANITGNNISYTGAWHGKIPVIAAHPVGIVFYGDFERVSWRNDKDHEAHC
jgi:hypothetical protein